MLIRPHQFDYLFDSRRVFDLIAVILFSSSVVVLYLCLYLVFVSCKIYPVLYNKYPKLLLIFGYYLILLAQITSKREHENFKLTYGIKNVAGVESAESNQLGRNVMYRQKHSFLVEKMEEHSLTKGEVERYSRQLLLPDFGVEGQQKLKEAKVLIVGAGGLGCPVAMYLASAGVGHLGILDYDKVELNNLHRQVGHSEQTLNQSKAISLQNFCINLNSNIKCTPYEVQLNSSNALEIISMYDLVCDCSDNAPTRYLINDACVLGKKPLVSGSALRWEGQLTIYNFENGPCYRCLFPIPPPPETVVSCSEGGVLGVVPGIIGNMQALEVIKILTGIGATFNQKLLLFDALRGNFRTINLRPKNVQCPICGDHPSITKLIDYEQFCGTGACDKVMNVKLLQSEDRISVEMLSEKLNRDKNFIILDCRPYHEFKICRLKSSHCLPLDTIEKLDGDGLNKKISSFSQDGSQKLKEIFVVCHRGNDSQNAVIILKQKLNHPNVKDVEGGLDEYAKKINPAFPRY